MTVAELQFPGSDTNSEGVLSLPFFRYSPAAAISISPQSWVLRVNLPAFPRCAKSAGLRAFCSLPTRLESSTLRLFVRGISVSPLLHLDGGSSMSLRPSCFFSYAPLPLGFLTHPPHWTFFLSLRIPELDFSALFPKSGRGVDFPPRFSVLL